jgi:hypothetical protein
MKKIILLIFLCIGGMRSYGQCSLASSTGAYDLCDGGPITSLTLTATGTCGAGTEVWTVINSGVATLASGGPGAQVVTYNGTIDTTSVIYWKGGVRRATALITVRPVPTVSITGASSVCFSGTPTVTLTGAPVGGSWSASNSNAFVTAGVVTGNLPGSVTITYDYTDGFGCDGSDTHPMTVDPTPNAGTLTGTFHTWPTLITTLTHTGQTGGNWGTSAAGVATVASTSATTADVTGVSAGVANITYSVTNTCGNNYTYKQVTVYPFPTMPSPSTIIDDPNNNTGRTIAGFNTAMIRCTPASGGGTAGHDYVYAFAHWDGGGSNAGEVIVVDNTNYPSGSGNGYASASLSGVPINTPDVVIVNDIAANPDVYRVAVAYPTASGVVVDIWYYDVTNNNTLNTTPDFTQSNSSYSPSVVHIDAIADYANPQNGLPNCQHAVLVWDNGSGTTILAETNLRSTGSVITGTPVSIGHGDNPDVAGIMRDVSGTHRVALIASTSTGPVVPYYKLYYAEYDLTAGAVARTASLDSALYPFEPRIDANDNENNNDTNAGKSYFKIAARVYNGFNYEINTYDNLLYYPTQALNYWTSSNVVAFGGSYGTPPYDHYSPSVAMVGPNSGGSDPDGTAFMVTHMTDDGAGTPKEAVFAEIIPYTTPNILMGGTYYWVSDDPAIDATADHLSASAPACNKVDGAAIVAWYDNNGSIDDIKCKISTCCYGFKPGEQDPGIKSIPLTKGWRLYPNPATAELVITNIDSKGGSYTITDVLGRTMLQGSFNGSSTTAHVSGLAPGTYVLKVYGVNGESVVKKFMKSSN